MVRIQFDIPNEVWDRVARFEPNYKGRHALGARALDEWLVRREARDRRVQIEQVAADAKRLLPALQALADEGYIEVKEIQ